MKTQLTHLLLALAASLPLAAVAQVPVQPAAD
ncbi:hypothetical protein AVME950_00815 [Acidovorax sp. SUPP950]|nr:hypothetical protein AVME950_00815 [Acidovorax sp. SUPP950]